MPSKDIGFSTLLSQAIIFEYGNRSTGKVSPIMTRRAQSKRADHRACRFEAAKLRRKLTTSLSQALKVDAAGMAAGFICVDGAEPARLKEQGWLLDQCQRHRWRKVLTSVDCLKSVRDSPWISD
jgi:hypothetical protein